MASKSKVIEQILVRPASFDDVSSMARVGMISNDGSDHSKLLSPLSNRYPEDSYRTWYQRMLLRWLNPETLCFVAYPMSSPSTVVGEIAISRVGDEGANREIASRKTIWMAILLWYYTMKFRIVNYFWPDRSMNLAVRKELSSLLEEVTEKYWSANSSRKNRWHIRSSAVLPDWQRKGIGMKLMEEVVLRAQAERVIIAVEASALGERLYRKCGFELLSRFNMRLDAGLDHAGGIMIWKPQVANASD